MERKFKLRNENDFFDDEQLYKYCASCGLQSSKSAKFCIECGSKKFYQTLKEYKFNTTLYCTSCLSHVGEKEKVCTCCGGKTFATADKAFSKYYQENFVDLSHTSISEMKKNSLVLKEKNEKLEKNILSCDDEIKNIEQNSLKLEEQFKQLEKDDTIHILEDKLNKLKNKTIDPKEALAKEKELKEVLARMEEITLLLDDFEKNILDKNQACTNLEKTVLALKDDIKFYECRINIAKIFKEKKTLKINLDNKEIESLRSKCQYSIVDRSTDTERLDMANKLLNESDPRTQLLYAYVLKKDIKDFYDIDYLKHTLEAYAKILTNVSSVKGKENISFDILLSKIYNGDFHTGYINSVKQKQYYFLKYLKNAIDCGHKEFEYLYKYHINK